MRAELQRVLRKLEVRDQRRIFRVYRGGGGGVVKNSVGPLGTLYVYMQINRNPLKMKESQKEV